MLGKMELQTELLIVLLELIILRTYCWGWDGF
jgi:hypothetical protein